MQRFLPARLKALFSFPVDQGANGLCGPVTFLNIWLELDPVGVARFATDHFDTGIGLIGSGKIDPDWDLVSPDSTAIQLGGRAPVPQADWMMASSLRDDKNLIFDYEGTPAEDWSEGTSLGDIKDWLDDTGLFRSVRQENYSLSDPSFADVAALVPSPNTKITLFIKTSMVGGSADGRHFVNLRTTLTRDAAGNIVGDVWTWASIRGLNRPEATFLDETMGWIVAEL